MSRTRNNAVRCDWCGKLSRDPDSAYRKADGTTGYIVQPEWERFPGGDHTADSVPSNNDICEECAANRCPACGTDSIVSVTPAMAGPDGFGGRCKSCNHQWSLPASNGTRP